jgi:hypothetical protein
VCGWTGHSVLEAEDPNTPVQYNMECSNCGLYAVEFVTDEECERTFEPSEEPSLSEPDWDDEGSLDDK